MTKKKLSACVRKGEKPDSKPASKPVKKAAKKSAKRVSVPFYLDQLDLAMDITLSELDTLRDEHWFLMGMHEGFSEVKRSLQELS